MNLKKITTAAAFALLTGLGTVQAQSEAIVQEGEFGVTLGAALALYKSGVHAVVDGGLSAGVPCSARNAPRTALQ